jgi:hypothetical protein
MSAVVRRLGHLKMVTEQFPSQLRFDESFNYNYSQAA